MPTSVIAVCFNKAVNEQWFWTHGIVQRKIRTVETETWTTFQSNTNHTSERTNVLTCQTSVKFVRLNILSVSPKCLVKYHSLNYPYFSSDEWMKIGSFFRSIRNCWHFTRTQMNIQELMREKNRNTNYYLHEMWKG